MILNWRNLSIAEARVIMLKARCDYLDRRIADPTQAMHAKTEAERRRERIAELEKEIRSYKDIIYRKVPITDYIGIGDLQQLPKEFIRRRLLLRISQAELGKAIGVSEKTIARYERTLYVSAPFKRIIQIDAVFRTYRKDGSDPSETHKG